MNKRTTKWLPVRMSLPTEFRCINDRANLQKKKKKKADSFQIPSRRISGKSKFGDSERTYSVRNLIHGSNDFCWWRQLRDTWDELFWPKKNNFFREFTEKQKQIKWGKRIITSRLPHRRIFESLWRSWDAGCRRGQSLRALQLLELLTKSATTTNCDKKIGEETMREIALDLGHESFFFFFPFLLILSRLRRRRRLSCGGYSPWFGRRSFSSPQRPLLPAAGGYWWFDTEYAWAHFWPILRSMCYIYQPINRGFIFAKQNNNLVYHINSHFFFFF